ncbi:MAG: ATP-binding protein [Pseudomonadota bacterium]
MIARLLPPPNSLARRTMALVALRISLIVVAASLVTYWHVSDSFEQASVNGLARFAEERRARESMVFDAAERSLTILKQGFEHRLPEVVSIGADRFDSLFIQSPDGSWRTREPLFEREAISGFVGKHVTLDQSLKIRLVAAYDLLRTLGPANDGVLPNAYVVLPENAVVMRWPGEAWALEAADWELFGKLSLALGRDSSGIAIAGARKRAEESVRWSDLYFDYGINDWMVSAAIGVNDEDGHVVTIGHDLVLHDLMERVGSEDLAGAYNVLMTGAGDLIAHPNYMDAIQAAGRALPSEQVTSPALKAMFARASESGVFQDPEADHYVSATRLAGPNWHLFTVFSSDEVTGHAYDVACLVLYLGLAALLLELGVLLVALRKEVGGPIRAFAIAADRVASGDLDARIDPNQRDELLPLANAFNGMVRELDQRDRIVRDRSTQLERVNARLETELTERRRTERELQRHKELNALLDSIDHGVLFLDASLHSRLANKAYHKIWNVPAAFYDRPRHIREDMLESWKAGMYEVGAEDWDAYLDERVETIREGKVTPTEMRLAGGTVLQYRCIPLPDGGRMLTYHDISKLKHAEERLQLHRAGMEVAMDGMAVLDQAGDYVYVNAAHATIYGFDEPNDMIGRHWREIYSTDELARFDRDVMPILFQSGRWRGEAVGMRRDGTTFPQEVSLAVMADGSLSCVVRDITERRQRENALDRAVRQAEEANRAKSRFLANMSHELRTPMNAIIGFSRIVLRRTEGQIEEKQHRNVGKILSSGEHLLRLINEILDISTIEAGQTAIRNAPYKPAVVIDHCLSTVEPMVQSGVVLKSRMGPGLSSASGDVEKVRQILVNLCSNAAKFTRKGSITIHARSAGERLLVDVVDTGIGIPVEAYERIFEEFGQVGEVRSAADREHGTGLGLTISRRLARLMGGDLTVESTVGKGSVFTLDLPLFAESASDAPIEDFMETVP